MPDPEGRHHGRSREKKLIHNVLISWIVVGFLGIIALSLAPESISAVYRSDLEQINNPASSRLVDCIEVMDISLLSRLHPLKLDQPKSPKLTKSQL